MHQFFNRVRRAAASAASIGGSSTLKSKLVPTVAVAATAATIAYTLSEDDSPFVAHAASASFPNPSSTKVLSYSSIGSQIANTLSESHRVDNIKRGRVDSVHVAQYNANVNIEDTYAYKPQLSSDTGALFGIFDGHSGRAASAFCRDELLDYMDLYKSSGNSDDVVSAKPLEHADQHFLTLASREGRFKDGIAGACVILSHIKGDIIRTASAGDCRSVVGRASDGLSPHYLPSVVTNGPILLTPSPFASSTMLPVELGTLHQIDLNVWEKERLLNAHPNEADIIRHSRVKGGLQPTRGFGDGTYKRMEFFLQRYAGSDAKRNRNWTPPYTTVTPDITEYTLNSQDKFMVMATDGLFEDMDPAMVVKYVDEYMKDSSLQRRHSHNCSRFLIEKALLHASERAVGRLKPEHNLSWILALPAGSRRNVHDDITVMVVFLNDGKEQGWFHKPEEKSKSPAVMPPTLKTVMSQENKAKL